MKNRNSTIAFMALALSGCASFYTGGKVSEAVERIAIPERPRLGVTELSVSDAAS